MIAIPNMDKPKSCKECELFYIEFYMGEDKMGSACTLNDDAGSTIEADYNSCPLIEIGDIEYQAYKEIMTMLLTKIEDRILYGERRADEINDRLLDDM